MNWAISSLGDVLSVIGLVVTGIGFWATIRGVRRSRKAAEEARDKIRSLESIIDFSEAITTLEEIKRLHRQGLAALPVLLDRYAYIRKILVQVRSSATRMNPSQRTVVQGALAHLRDMEGKVERALKEGTELKVCRLNVIISDDIDGLVAVLEELKSSPEGETNEL